MFFILLDKIAIYFSFIITMKNFAGSENIRKIARILLIIG